MPDTSMWGSQTVLGPGWVNIDEEELSAAAALFEELAAHLRGIVVPQLQGQKMGLSDVWHGTSSDAAMHEATVIIDGHTMNANQASAIANQLRRMESTVARVKSTVNATAQRVQQQCQSIMDGPGFGPEKLVAIQATVAEGLGQNMTDVTAGATELGDDLGVAAQGLPTTPGMPGGGGPQEAMQMISQMTSQVSQVPQQFGKMAGGANPAKGLMQPLQQLTSMFGQKGGHNAGPKPFSNHPLTGGNGPRSGAGLARGGGGGGGGRNSLMSSLVGNRMAPVATAPATAGAGSPIRGVGGSAPVGAAGGASGGGTGGMAGSRGESSGTRTAMAVPGVLDHDLTDDDGGDEDW